MGRTAQGDRGMSGCECLPDGPASTLGGGQAGTPVRGMVRGRGGDSPEAKEGAGGRPNADGSPSSRDSGQGIAAPGPTRGDQPRVGTYGMVTLLRAIG